MAASELGRPRRSVPDGDERRHSVRSPDCRNVRARGGPSAGAGFRPDGALSPGLADPVSGQARAIDVALFILIIGGFWGSSQNQGR